MPFARPSGMSTTHEPDVQETEVIDRPVVEHRVERVERVHEPAAQTNVSTANQYAPVWTTTRVVTLLFTVLEVLLLIRFALKLLGANPQQALVTALYNVTAPLPPSCALLPRPLYLWSASRGWACCLVVSVLSCMPKSH